MAMRFVVTNGHAATATTPNPGVTTSASLVTMLQLVPNATSAQLTVIEWSVSFNASVLGAAFPCDLVETAGSVGASVTAFNVADVMTYTDPNTPANTSGTGGFPLELSTTLSGFTSQSEGNITAQRVFDQQFINPVAGYTKQFPLGREPGIKPGNFLRLRVTGDGTTKVLCQVVFEV